MKKRAAMEQSRSGFLSLHSISAPLNIVAETYWNRDKRDFLKYTRMDQKKEKRLNRVNYWCIVTCHGGFNGMELYAVERWVEFITGGADTAYSPIDNPLIKNSKKTEVPLEGGKKT